MEFTLKTSFPVKPEELYRTWMNSEGHGDMTGGAASISDEVGSSFEAWDNYISGKNLELEAGKRILQSWRTTEFEDSDQDSMIEVFLRSIPEGTELTLVHSNLSRDAERYEKGWEEHYFAPMRAYFAKQ